MRIAGWQPLGRRVDPVLVDRALAVLLTLSTQLSIWVGHDADGHRLGACLVGLVITASIAVRRQFPFLVGTMVPVVGAVEHALWSPQWVGYPLTEFLALYALAVWTTTRQFLVGTTAIVAASFASSALTGGSMQDTVPFVVVVVVVMVLVRRVVGDRDRRAELAERERDVAAREAVVQERGRIARELHDVIAHNVSMMVVQAGAERRALDGGSASTREALKEIEGSGREALTEMRRLVGMLRDDGPDPLLPQPSLDDLPKLVGQLGSAGLPVDLQVEGDRRTLPAGIELSAYRIVQEALTNCLKHAGDARAAVRVRYGTDALELEIIDTGSRADDEGPGLGHGLVGMRERVALYGGRFDAGRRLEGGFAVRVRLPVR